MALIRSSIGRAWFTAQPGSDWLLCGAASGAWRFINLFLIRMREHIAGLTLKNVADLLQRFKIDSQCLTLLQPPQGRMADTRLFSQPIEGSAANSQ